MHDNLVLGHDAEDGVKDGGDVREWSGRSLPKRIELSDMKGDVGLNNLETQTEREKKMDGIGERECVCVRMWERVRERRFGFYRVMHIMKKETRHKSKGETETPTLLRSIIEWLTCLPWYTDHAQCRHLWGEINETVVWANHTCDGGLHCSNHLQKIPAYLKMITQEKKKRRKKSTSQ